MIRREFLGGLGGLMLRPSFAHASEKSVRVGLIYTTSPVSEMAGPDPIIPSARSFVHGLRDLGYIEGRNLVLERRSAEGHVERFPEIIAGLIDLKVEVIVTVSNELTQAAKRITQTIPIVMANSYDPVAAGLVESLPRPGGNVTGLTANAGPEIETKRLQLLRECLPTAVLVAFLGTRNDWESPQGASARNAAATQGFSLIFAEAFPGDYTAAFQQMRLQRPQAIFLARHPTHYANRKLIADFALEQRLPGTYPFRESVEVGGLMSYGQNVSDMYRRAAIHVAKILEGAKPGDLPVEQPTKFEFLINLKTAGLLEIQVPQNLLALADELIE